MPIKGAISCSVGRNGQNQFSDTQTVQELLNAEMARNQTYANAAGPRLKPDGKCGALTEGAIETFQAKVLFWNASACDGRIDPNGKSWKKLNGNVANSNAIMAAPVTAEIQGAAAASAGSSNFSFFPYDQGFYGAPFAPTVPTPAAVPPASPITPVRQGAIAGTLGSGSLSIAGYGCAMCTLTMAANSVGSRNSDWPDGVQPKDLTPLQANTILKKAGAFSGSLLNMEGAARALGMTPHQYGFGAKALPAADQAYAQVTGHLRNYPVAANVDYKKGAAGDHWVLLTGIAGRTISAIDPATGRKMTFSSTSTDRTRTTNSDTGFLFGTDGSSNQNNYAVIRYILLSPASSVAFQ